MYTLGRFERGRRERSLGPDWLSIIVKEALTHDLHFALPDSSAFFGQVSNTISSSVQPGKQKAKNRARSRLNFWRTWKLGGRLVTSTAGRVAFCVVVDVAGERSDESFARSASLGVPSEPKTLPGLESRRRNRHRCGGV